MDEHQQLGCIQVSSSAPAAGAPSGPSVTRTAPGGGPSGRPRRARRPVKLGACGLAAAAVVLWPSAVQGSQPQQASSPAGATSDVYLVTSSTCTPESAFAGSAASKSKGCGYEELSDFSLSIVASGAPAAVGSSIIAAHPDATLNEATATMNADDPSLALFKDVAAGTREPAWEVDFKQPGTGGSPDVYFELRFQEVSLTSFTLNDTAGDTSVSITFSFQKVEETTYMRDTASGALGKVGGGGYNLNTAKSA